jgi:predicted metal-dependent phosphoesterase TrpH
MLKLSSVPRMAGASVYSAPMLVDLHTHTYPASTCSSITYRDYVAWCADRAVEAVALTNHGDASDNRKLEPALAAEGVLLIHGVEISTLFGDFVVFSPDLDYLDTLRPVQDALRAEEVPEHAAVVWVHPIAGGGRSGSVFYPGLERMVAPAIHGVEVYNGNWLGQRYVEGASSIARQFALAQTGGSDAHTPGALGRCATQLPDPVRATADVVDALRRGLTEPYRDDASRARRRFGLFKGR